MQDNQGRPYARLSEVKAGDTLEADDNGVCISAGTYTVMPGLYIICRKGKHYLNGQLSTDGVHLIGLYPCSHA